MIPQILFRQDDYLAVLQFPPKRVSVKGFLWLVKCEGIVLRGKPPIINDYFEYYSRSITLSQTSILFFVREFKKSRGDTHGTNFLRRANEEIGAKNKCEFLQKLNVRKKCGEVKGKMFLNWSTSFNFPSAFTLKLGIKLVYKKSADEV